MVATCGETMMYGGIHTEKDSPRQMLDQYVKCSGVSKPFLKPLNYLNEIHHYMAGYLEYVLKCSFIILIDSDLKVNRVITFETKKN